MSNMKISNSVEEARLVHFLLWQAAKPSGDKCTPLCAPPYDANVLLFCDVAKPLDYKPHFLHPIRAFQSLRVGEMKASVERYAADACLEALARSAVFVGVHALATEQSGVVFGADAVTVALHSALVVEIEAADHGVEHFLERRLPTYYII